MPCSSCSLNSISGSPMARTSISRPMAVAPPTRGGSSRSLTFSDYSLDRISTFEHHPGCVSGVLPSTPDLRRFLPKLQAARERGLLLRRRAQGPRLDRAAELVGQAGALGCGDRHLEAQLAPVVGLLQ